MLILGSGLLCIRLDDTVRKDDDLPNSQDIQSSGPLNNVGS